MNETAYPLQWPPGWPKTESTRRERGLFKTTLPTALNKLKHELDLMGAKNILLSSNYTLGIQNPKDPGVVAYFQWKELPMSIPCDRWSRIEHNVQAIALTVEAMRGMKRWGAEHMIRAMFTGFKALPAGISGQAWHEVLGVEPSLSAELIRARYRELVKQYHPDAGGNAEKFRDVQAAFESWEKHR